MDGFLLLHKPAGITSFDCVMLLKKQLALATKVGHTGTLDAFASGLLIIAIGRPATAQIKQVMVLDKMYQTQALLGVQTDTLDPTGTIVSTSEYIPTQQQLAAAFATLQPRYWQIPPLFSALKHKGERLSDLSRQQYKQDFLNRLAHNKKNLVDIYDATITQWDALVVHVNLHVSHGTYIRSIIKDVAQLVGSCAHVTQLTRCAIGPFHLADAVHPSQLTCHNYRDYLVTPDRMKQMIDDYLHAVNQKKLQQRLQQRMRKLS